MASVKDGPYHLEAVHLQTICFIHQDESSRIWDRPLERFESLVSLKVARISGWAITRGTARFIQNLSSSRLVLKADGVEGLGRLATDDAQFPSILREPG